MTAEPRHESTLFVVSAISQWKNQVADVGVAAGMNCVSAHSLARFLAAAGDHDGPACAFIDVEVPDIDWSTLHQLMLERNLEIPVVVVADEPELKKACQAAKCCVSLVITRPTDNNSIREAIDAALSNQKVVGHQFAVERNYRRLLTLDERERSIVDLAVDGAPNKQIANRLGLSVKTIERIRKNAYRKLDVRSTAEMTRAVILGGLHDIVATNHPVLAGSLGLPGLMGLQGDQYATAASLSGSTT